MSGRGGSGSFGSGRIALGMPSGKVGHHPGWKPLQGSAATMSQAGQAGLQARAGSPDPLRGPRHVSVQAHVCVPSRKPLNVARWMRNARSWAADGLGTLRNAARL